MNAWISVRWKQLSSYGWWSPRSLVQNIWWTLLNPNLRLFIVLINNQPITRQIGSFEAVSICRLSSNLWWSICLCCGAVMRQLSLPDWLEQTIDTHIHTITCQLMWFLSNCSTDGNVGSWFSYGEVPGTRIICYGVCRSKRCIRHHHADPLYSNRIEGRWWLNQRLIVEYFKTRR